jgi:hypothetical protein
VVCRSTVKQEQLPHFGGLHQRGYRFTAITGQVN